MRRIAVVNQESGVGKTTISANLGHALALAGHRVTLMDLDPRGHLSAHLGMFRAPSKGLADLMLGEAQLEQVVIRSRDRLTLITCGPGLGDLEELQEGGAARGRLLANALDGQLSDQDFVLMDCPPSSGLLLANAALAADEVLIPVTSEYSGLNGLVELMQTLKGLQAFRKQPLRHWIGLSRFQPRRRSARELADKLNQHFPGRVLGSSIREAAVLVACSGVGRSVFEFRPGSRSASEFEALALELSGPEEPHNPQHQG